VEDAREHRTGSTAPSVVRPVDLRDYVRFSQAAATRVRVFATEVLTVDLWCLEPQQETVVLTYDDVDVAYTVIGGHGWFVTDEGEIGLAALGSILVPAGSAHAIDNRHADPLVVLASAAPPDVALDALVEDAPVSDAAEAVFQGGS
jgi:quercetin dioxygenase-like cupin family protein